MVVNDVSTKVNIGNLCTTCGQDTSYGSGKFVNRIPSDGFEATLVLHTDSEIYVVVEGYMCAECQLIECDICGELTLDYALVDGTMYCSDCIV